MAWNTFKHPSTQFKPYLIPHHTPTADSYPAFLSASAVFFIIRAVRSNSRSPVLLCMSGIKT